VCSVFSYHFITLRFIALKLFVEKHQFYLFLNFKASILFVFVVLGIEPRALHMLGKDLRPASSR
jgi:hypothetical protein